MDKTLNRRRGHSLVPNSILKSIIKIGFQLTDKRTMYTYECLQEGTEFHTVGAATRKLRAPKLSFKFLPRFRRYPTMLVFRPVRNFSGPVRWSRRSVHDGV